MLKWAIAHLYYNHQYIDDCRTRTQIIERLSGKAIMQKIHRIEDCTKKWYEIYVLNGTFWKHWRLNDVIEGKWCDRESEHRKIYFTRRTLCELQHWFFSLHWLILNIIEYFGELKIFFPGFVLYWMNEKYVNESLLNNWTNSKKSHSNKTNLALRPTKLRKIGKLLEVAKRLKSNWDCMKIKWRL